MADLILALIVFAIIIAILSVLRAKIGEKFEIKNSDILLAIIPIALWFVLTGKIQTFQFGDFKIEAAFVEAAEAAITPQITSLKELPVEPVETESKGGVRNIPRLIEKKTEALTFHLGYGGYYGPAIKQYLDELSVMPSFKYVVILNRDGTFAGLCDARLLNATLANEYNGHQKFANWLNNADEAPIKQLPGYIGSEKAIYKNIGKQSALEKMDQMDIEMLPVVSAENRFVGIVERSRLVSSMIIEVTQKLK